MRREFHANLHALVSQVGQPRLVALVPQLGQLDSETGATQLPCGLHVIVLPFSEDVRSVARPDALQESDFTPSQLESARSLASALQLPTSKSPIVAGAPTVSNPAVQTHFSYLQMLALNVPGVSAEPTVDGTLPDVAWLTDRQPQLDAFQEAFNLTDVATAEAAAGAGAKRQKTTAPKAEKLGPPESFAEWLDAHNQERLESLTNAPLKAFCKEHSLPVGGKKGDLVARVHDFLQAFKEQEAAKTTAGAGPST